MRARHLLQCENTEWLSRHRSTQSFESSRSGSTMTRLRSWSQGRYRLSIHALGLKRYCGLLAQSKFAERLHENG